MKEFEYIFFISKYGKFVKKDWDVNVKVYVWGIVGIYLGVILYNLLFIYCF